MRTRSCCWATAYRRWLLLAAGIVACALVSPLAAQPPGAVPPPPVPASPAAVYRPGGTYDSLRAGQDAYGWAERDRLAQIARQLQIEDEIRRTNTWLPPGPLAPGLGGSPYYGTVAQPTGHEKLWTGPNSYVYRPRWDLPPTPPRPLPPVRAYRQWPMAPISPSPPAAAPPRTGEIPPPPPPEPPLEPPPDAPLPPTARSL